MGFLDELVPGFVGRQRYIEERNRQDDIQSREKEGRIYEALLGSSDPHVQTMALSGLLESAMPGAKAKGLKGWMGEREKSPIFQQLQQYISTPVQETTSTPGARTPELPLQQSLPGQVQGPIGTPQATVTAPPPPTASAAMPTTSAVTGGPPPVTTGSQTAPGSMVFSKPTPAQPAPGIQGPPTLTTTSHPRQIFDSLEEATRKKYTAEALGKQEGDLQAWLNAGGTEAEWRQMEQAKGRRAAGVGAAATYREGEITPDATSPTGFSQLLYLASDPTKTQKIPAMNPAKNQGRFFGQDLESISREPAFGGKPYAEQDAAGAARVNAEKGRRAVQAASDTATARGNAQIQTDLNKPIGPTAGQQYNVPPTTLLKDLTGVAGMTEAEKTKIASLGAADDSVAKITDLVKQVFPDVEPGMLGGIKTSFSLALQKLNRDEDLAQLDSALKLASINIARVAGETGRIPVQLVEQAQNALGNIHPDAFGGDTRATALAKLQVVQGMLETARAYAPGGAKGSVTPPPGRTGAPAAQPAAASGTNATVPNLFVGSDGKLHTGSPTGPIYQAGR